MNNDNIINFPLKFNKTVKVDNTGARVREHMLFTENLTESLVVNMIHNMSENGIDVDDCAEVSRQVGALLDVEDPISTEYNLEVSSPGVDRPLFTLAHYQAVVGETVNIKLSLPLNGRRKFKGQLTAIENDTLIVMVDGEDFELVISNIDKGNLVHNFDK